MSDKYGRIVAERKEFHEDEPVFVLRAQDTLAPLAVDAYAAFVRAAATGTAIHLEWDAIDLLDIADECENVAAAMRVWQSAHPEKVKLPD